MFRRRRGLEPPALWDPGPASKVCRRASLVVVELVLAADRAAQDARDRAILTADDRGQPLEPIHRHLRAVVRLLARFVGYGH
jgi:hypothetical protein